MNESGPVKRPVKTSGNELNFSDLQQITPPNTWKAVSDGKLWLLKTAEIQEMQFICDTIYSRLIGKLGEIEVSIPQKNPGR